MVRLRKTREHTLLAALALLVTLGLACKTPGASAPVSAGGSGNATDGTEIEPDTATLEQPTTGLSAEIFVLGRYLRFGTGFPPTQNRRPRTAFPPPMSRARLPRGLV
jgi:hypothetical protein